ncbi:MAG: hypothetical protein LBI03_06860 [Clostridiales bacterium]|jgi:hypothetical protein|nr:hypothetical protein [Clostridiales bacterium]
MEKSKRPLWKKSMLQTLNLDDIMQYLDEIIENGDMFGYKRYYENESGYYQEYKEQFDELSDGAYTLYETLQEYDLKEHWDDMTVALLGETQKVLGFDAVEAEYFGTLSDWEENRAIEEAIKRIERLNKRDMIKCFRNVMVTLVSFFDIKAAHDCLISIVEELDERAAFMQTNGQPPQRAFIE